MDNQKREEEIMAFEDFQKHSRQEQNEYEGGRWRLRQEALRMSEKPGSAYRRTVYGRIEPIFTLADHHFLRAAHVVA